MTYHRPAIGTRFVIPAWTLLFGAVLLAQTPRTGPAVRTVRGRVLSSDTGEALPYALVVVTGTATWTRADLAGRFAISAASSAVLTITKAGYLDEQSPVSRLPSGATADLRLTRTAAIAGRVTDEHGDPIVGASVTASLSTAGTDTPRRANATTNDLGEYRLGRLRAGAYAVSVVTRTDEQVATARPGGGYLLGPRTFRTFYPDSLEETDAVPVSLAAGDERGNIDFHVPRARASAALFMQVITPGLPGLPPPPVGTSAIRGQVITTDGRPLPFARAVLCQDFCRESRNTDEGGHYEFTGLPAGTYRIAASKPGYSLPSDGPGPLERGNGGVMVDVDADDTRDRVDVTLRRWAALSGRLVDDDGEPVVDARVGLVVTRYVGGRRRIAGFNAMTATTDERGEFRIFAVPDGQYLLVASTPSVASELPGAVPTFYPGTTEAAAGRFLRIAAGDDLRGLDFPLELTRTATVSGSLVNAAGQPTTGGRFTLVSEAAFATRVDARIEADGKFQFQNVPPGRYVIQADRGRLSGFREGEFGAFPIIVGRTNIDGLRLQTLPGSRIAGRVTFDSVAAGRLPMPGSVELSPIPADFDRAPASVATTAPHDDSSFELLGITGARRLQAIRVPAGWTLRTIRSNGRDITDEVIDFGRPDQSLDDVEVIVSDRANEIAGRVTDSRARPVAGARVVLFSTSRERWYHASRFVKSTVTRADGSYAVSGLPTDSYFAVAVRDVPPGDESWYDVVFLDSIRSDGTVVAVGEGDRQSVNLRLNPQVRSLKVVEHDDAVEYAFTLDH
jgi:protocatechuate 3,4-dioxygenase beta subunit